MTTNAPRSTFAVIVVIATFAVTSQRVGRPDELGAESGAIAALRAITSGEQSYAASMNGGAFDTLECLLSGACVPGQHAVCVAAPDLANRLDFRGYRLDFHAGPKAEPTVGIRTKESLSAVSRYAVVAVPGPSQPAARRGFCTDDRVVIYVIAAGVTPRVEDGRCLDTATPVQ